VDHLTRDGGVGHRRLLKSLWQLVCIQNLGDLRVQGLECFKFQREQLTPLLLAAD